MFKNKVIPIDHTLLTEAAEQGFVKICGFDLEKPKHKRMMGEAMSLRESIVGNFNIQALVSVFEEYRIDGDVMTLDGAPMKCKAFAQMRTEDILRVYSYIVTVGAPPEVVGDDSMVAMLYTDSWGTAYIDAADHHIKEILRQDAGTDAIMSNVFGPGFYGMDVSEMRTLFSLMDYSQIGVMLTDHGLIVPQKSCAGYYFIVKENAYLPNSACLDCLGNKSGCMYCNVRSPYRAKGAR